MQTTMTFKVTTDILDFPCYTEFTTYIKNDVGYTIAEVRKIVSNTELLDAKLNIQEQIFDSMTQMLRKHYLEFTNAHN